MEDSDSVAVARAKAGPVPVIAARRGSSRFGLSPVPGALFPGQRELEFLFGRVHAVQADAYLIADREGAAGPLADNLAVVFPIREAVAGQRIERDQSFDEQIGELDKKAEARGGDDQRVELVAGAIDHELH